MLFAESGNLISTVIFDIIILSKYNIQYLYKTKFNIFVSQDIYIFKISVLGITKSIACLQGF